MSHYSKVKTLIKNRACLVKALADVGFKDIEVYDIAQPLVGFQNDIRKDKANVIVRRKYVGSASNDLGFVLQEDGTYGAIISDYDSSTYNKKWLDKLQQRYSLHVVEETAHNENYYIQDTTTDAEGNIYVTLETQD